MNVGYRWTDEDAIILQESIRYVTEFCEMSDGPVEVTVTGNQLTADGVKCLEPFTMRRYLDLSKKGRIKSSSNTLFVTGLRNQVRTNGAQK